MSLITSIIWVISCHSLLPFISNAAISLVTSCHYWYLLFLIPCRYQSSCLSRLLVSYFVLYHATIGRVTSRHCWYLIFFYLKNYCHWLINCLPSLASHLFCLMQPFDYLLSVIIDIVVTLEGNTIGTTTQLIVEQGSFYIFAMLLVCCWQDDTKIP